MDRTEKYEIDFIPNGSVGFFEVRNPKNKWPASILYIYTIFLMQYKTLENMGIWYLQWKVKAIISQPSNKECLDR